MKRYATFFFILAFCLSLDATLVGQKICVDPGHGGSDPGALGVNGSAYPDEADLVLDIDLRFQTLLNEDGASVLMTRDTDTYITLANRVDQANSWGATIFLSTHLNSVATESVSGTETYAYQSGTTADSLAHKVQTELLDHLGRVDRGVKYGDLYVIRYTSMPAILSEGLFVSNQGDFDYIVFDSSRQEHAVALYHAVCAHFGVDPKDGPAPGTLNGFVYNLTTGLGNIEGNRIADATVTIAPVSGTPLVTTSADTGLFTFLSAAAGDYTLMVEKTGFMTTQKTVTVVSGIETWASTGIEEEGSVTDDEPPPDNMVSDDALPDETAQNDEAGTDTAPMPDDFVSDDTSPIDDEHSDEPVTGDEEPVQPDLETAPNEPEQPEGTDHADLFDGMSIKDPDGNGCSCALVP